MNLNITSGGTVSVSEEAFGREFNEALVHQVVNAYLAGGRQGTKAQKSRANVRGGGKKPWRQKGTGRARAGTSSSPIWRSGGVTFAATPRDFTEKLNRKMYKGAMACIASELVRQKRLVVVEDFLVESFKTKALVEKLKAHGLQDVLIVVEDVDENLYLASRNIPGVGMVDVSAVDPVALISHQWVLMTKPALKQFEEMLG